MATYFLIILFLGSQSPHMTIQEFNNKMECVNVGSGIQKLNEKTYNSTKIQSIACVNSADGAVWEISLPK